MVALATSSAIFLADNPKGPTLGANEDAPAASPPKHLKFIILISFGSNLVDVCLWCSTIRSLITTPLEELLTAHDAAHRRQQTADEVDQHEQAGKETDGLAAVRAGRLSLIDLSRHNRREREGASCAVLTLVAQACAKREIALARRAARLGALRQRAINAHTTTAETDALLTLVVETRAAVGTLAVRVVHDHLTVDVRRLAVLLDVVTRHDQPERRL